MPYLVQEIEKLFQLHTVQIVHDHPPPNIVVKLVKSGFEFLGEFGNFIKLL